jgi:hypothetical protein
MRAILTRIVDNLVGRVHGPMRFRIVVQPLMAVVFALMDGRKDAREHRSAYFWALFTEPEHRSDRLRTTWEAVGKIFVIALIIDAVYQFRVLHWFYVGEALLVALLLAVVPYVALRGPVNRLTRRRKKTSPFLGHLAP